MDARNLADARRPAITAADEFYSEFFFCRGAFIAVDQRSVRGPHGHVATSSTDVMKVRTGQQIDDERNGRFVDIDFTGEYAVMNDRVFKGVYFEVQCHVVFAMNTNQVECFGKRKPRREEQLID
jgi:hypothetical protein